MFQVHQILVLKAKIDEDTTVSLCLTANLQVADGTFLEEPGSGAIATVDNKKVSVGTLEWISRYSSF